MSAAFDYREHYKAVKARLNKGNPYRRPEPRILGVVIYDLPVGPERPLRDILLIATSHLPKPFGVGRPSYVLAGEIVAEVCAARGVTPHDVAGPWRFRPVTLARQEICYRLRKETTWSFPQIGHYLGKRDHTTVLHGYRTHAKKHGLPL